MFPNLVIIDTTRAVFMSQEPGDGCGSAKRSRALFVPRRERLRWPTYTERLEPAGANDATAVAHGVLRPCSWSGCATDRPGN